MIVGETITITCLTPASTTAPTAMSLSILLPTGVPDTPPSVSAAQNPDTTWTLSAVYTFALPGAYQALWSYTIEGGAAGRFSQVYFAGWTDIPPVVVRILTAGTGNTSSFGGDPETALGPVIALVTSVLVSRYDCLQPDGYAGLTGPDRIFFDSAVALIIAARLRPLLPKTPTGELMEWTEEDIRERYQAPLALPAGAIEAGLASEAALLLGRVSCIMAMYTARAASFSTFKVSGATRARQTAGVPNTPFADLATLLTDDWRWYPGYPGYPSLWGLEVG